MQHAWGDEEYVIILVRNLKGINHLADLRIDGSTILRTT
jgi:hypothetical protein